MMTLNAVWSLAIDAPDPASAEAAALMGDLYASDSGAKS